MEGPCYSGTVASRMPACRFSSSSTSAHSLNQIVAPKMTMGTSRLNNSYVPYCNVAELPPSSAAPGSVVNFPTVAVRQRTSSSRKGSMKSSYKHVPHREKAPHLVARRNARERRRVQAVNNAFIRLRRHVPYENKHKRLSKVKTLRIAIDYINEMQAMVDDYDLKYKGHAVVRRNEERAVEMVELTSSKENEMQWAPINMVRI